MAWDLNRTILVGRLSSDVDLKYTQQGTAVARFGMAVGGKPKPDGSETVSFFNIVAWGKAGENAKNYLGKGDQIGVDGHLQQNTWTAQDGTKRYSVEVIADRVEYIQKKRDNAQPQKPAANPPQRMTQQQADDSFYDQTGFDPTPVDPNEIDPDFIDMSQFPKQ